MIAKYQISVWSNDDPNPDARTVAFSPEVWGSVAAEVETLKAHCDDLKADGHIDRYIITELDAIEIDATEAADWLESFEQESNQ